MTKKRLQISELPALQSTTPTTTTTKREEANVVKQCMSWEPKTTKKKNQPTNHQQPTKSRVKIKSRIKSRTSATEEKKSKEWSG